VGDVAIKGRRANTLARAHVQLLAGHTPAYMCRSSSELTPLALQTRLAFSDDAGALGGQLARRVQSSFIDRPWLAVYASQVSANLDQVYVAYHDFSASQNQRGGFQRRWQLFGPSVDVLGTNGIAFLTLL